MKLNASQLDNNDIESNKSLKLIGITIVPKILSF